VSARPSGRNRDRRAKRNDICARGAGAMSTRRISHERLQHLAAELPPRDRSILQMVATLHLVTGSQLVRVHWPAASDADLRAARRTLLRLAQWRVLARLDRRLGGLGRGSDSWTYAVDTAGQRLLASESRTVARRPHLPRPAFWAHALTASEVYTRLVEATRGTPRSLTQWQGEPEAWRRFAGPYGEQLLLKPDAFVELDDASFTDLYLVEIDTGSQSRPVIRAKLNSYLKYAASGQEQAAQGGVFPRVVFLTTTLPRHGLLVDLLGELPPEHWPLFAVGLVADAPRLLGGEELSP